MKCNRMMAVLSLLLLFMIQGCDKKVSNATVNNAQSVQAAVLTATTTQTNIVGKVAAVNAGKDDVVAEIVSNDRDSLERLLYMSNRLVAGLKAKSKLSNEAILQIRESENTVISIRQGVAALKPKLKPKTEADSAALVSWTQNIEPQLTAVIDALAKLNASIKADVPEDVQ